MKKPSEWFTRNKVLTLQDNAPQWLLAAIRDAHNGMFPDDWVFETCYHACLALDEGSLTSDTSHEFVDSEVDIYTRDLYRWAADHCLSNLFAEAEDQANEAGPTLDTADRLRAIQFYAIDYIAGVMLNAYEEHAQ